MAWLNPARLAQLQGPEGCEWLVAAAEAGEDPFVVSRLQQRFPGADTGVLAAAVEQVRLRHRAQVRFSRAETMWFAESLLEQASSEAVARRHADRFARWAAGCSQAPRIGDLCCGLGSDSLELARWVPGSAPIRAVDRAPLAVALTQANAHALGLADRIVVLCADVATDLPELDAAWMDPGRREGARRTRRLEEMSPPLACLLEWTGRLSAAGIKLSPASDPGELNQYLAGEAVEWEWISSRGSCRELVIWFGGTAESPGQRSATVVEAGQSLVGVPLPYLGLSPVGPYLLEPDPAVIRAGLVGNLAAELGASQGYRI